MIILTRSKIGNVVSTERGPSFYIVPVRIDKEKDVKQGQLLYCQIAQGNGESDSYCILRVSSAREFNPYEDPQTSQIKEIFKLDSGSGNSELIRKYMVADTEPIEVVVRTSRGLLLESPAIVVPSGAPVFDELSDDLARAVLGFPKPDDKGSLTLGSTIGPRGTTVCLDAARVLPRHILIVGSTGTGKSWLLGKIAEQLHTKGVRMINIDIHGEMNKAISEMGGDILVPGDTLKVPLSSLAEPEILGMVPLVNDLHIDILTRAVINLKSGRKQFGIDELLGEAESVADTYGVKQNTKDIIDARIKQLKTIPFIGEGVDWKAKLANDGTIINIDCRYLQYSQLQTVIAAITRDVYTARQKGVIPPIVMAVDEAHMFLPATEKAETATVLSQLIRMGRHIAFGLILVSQSPGDLDKRVAKITNTRFIFAIEPSELSSIYGFLADAPQQLIQNIPRMKTGTCLLVGNRETVRHATIFEVGKRDTTHGGDTPPMI